MINIKLYHPSQLLQNSLSDRSAVRRAQMSSDALIRPHLHRNPAAAQPCRGFAHRPQNALAAFPGIPLSNAEIIDAEDAQGMIPFISGDAA